MSAFTHGPALWYATRATGLVTLLLLTVTVLLGILTTGRFATGNWPRFLTVGLHRNLSLLTVVFVALHVATTVVEHLHGHLADGGVRTVQLVLQDVLAGPGRGRARPAHRPGGDQPDQEPARGTRLARGPLGRLRLLAGRAGARTGRRYRPEHPVGVRAHRRQCRGGRRGGHLALRRRGPGRCPVTSLALNAYRAPELRLPRLLAGVSYYHPTGLAEHEELYGPLPLPAAAARQPHQAAAARASD